MRQGASYREIATELKVSRATLVKVLTKSGLTAKTTHKDQRQKRKSFHAQAVELYKQGLKIRDISVQTGISVTSFYNRHLAKLREIVELHIIDGRDEKDRKTEATTA